MTAQIATPKVKTQLEMMNRLAYSTAGQAIETLQQVEAIISSFATLQEHLDSQTAHRILWAAETLVAHEIERLDAAQAEALACETERGKAEESRS